MSSLVWSHYALTLAVDDSKFTSSEFQIRFFIQINF